MLTHRKTARAFLFSQDRPTFLEIVYRAKVSPAQKEILYKHILDEKELALIGDEIGLTENRVSHLAAEAYDLIYNYITKNNILPTE